MKKFKELNMNEQHREKGRFKPTAPHIVPNVATASPRKSSDSADVRLKEDSMDTTTLASPAGNQFRQGDTPAARSFIDKQQKEPMKKYKEIKEESDIEIPKDAPSVEDIAKKHGVSVDEIKNQLKIGMSIEAEHGKNKSSQREIAMDHLNEKPDYYKKLKKYVEETEKVNEMLKPKMSALDKFRQASAERSKKHDNIERDMQARHAAGKEDMKGSIDRLEKSLNREETELQEGQNKQVEGGDPCWKNYQMVGKKMKNGKEVPNCVPVKEAKDDDVGEMIKDKLKIIINRAQEMHDEIGDAEDMPEWVKSKVTLAQDYISTACDYSCGKEQLGEEEMKKHPFVAVHAKKGKHETHGSTSYEAAQNAAKHWKMKNTAGIDVYRADKTHVAEEVELDEASTYKLGRAAAETKEFPIKQDGEHVGRLEFHVSAGKLHHRAGNAKGVSYEKWHGNPNTEALINSHVAKHEAEARAHFAKKLKEEVEELDEAPVVIKTNKEIGAKVTSIGPGGKETTIKTDSAYAKYRKMGSSPANARARAAGEKNPKVFESEELQETSKPPFDGPYTTVKKTITDKSGAKHTPMSRAKDLARKALSNQSKALKPVVREEKDDSRKAEIVKNVMKSAKKKKSESAGDDKFESEPVLSSETQKQ